jgi:Flp pilus assembly protein TadD
VPTRRGYAPFLAGVVVLIAAGAYFSIPSIRGWRIWGPFAAAERVASEGSARTRPVPSSIHTIPNMAVPAPDAAAVQTQTKNPVGNAAPKAVRWTPSDRQKLRDLLYLAGKANKPLDAIAAIEAWDAAHPGDPEFVRELARLLARNGRETEAFSRYRQLLAIQPDTGVRAEYAAALLARQEYDSAAADYRVLVAGDSSDGNYHLGLARALAWGNHPREAEPELRWLVIRSPDDTTLVSMLRIARGAYDPSADAAARWVAEDPSYEPYRLALARAASRERQWPVVFAEFDTLIAANPSLDRIREAAGVHATAGDSTGDALLLRRAVSMSPGDVTIRRSYAEALAWSGDRGAAIVQYDTLLMTGAKADLLLARGRLHEWNGEGTLAERDLAAAAWLQPSPASWSALGDLYRWTGDRPHAREAYGRALDLHAGDSSAVAGLNDIALAERREAYAVLSQDLGWRSFASSLSDNARFDLRMAGLNGGVSLNDQTAFTFAADGRHLGDANGWSTDVGFVNHFRRFRLAADGGVSHYQGQGDFGFGAASAAGGWRGLWTSVGASTGPAYQTLMSLHTLRYWNGNASVTVPVRPISITVGVDELWLNDGNTRTQLQLGAKYPWRYGFSAIYSGGVVGFDHASADYWDPRQFMSHSVGIEFAHQRETGFSFSARVLPGIGSSPAVFADAADQANRSVAQLQSGFAAEYRRGWWALSVDGDYARGVRENGYHAARAAAALRIIPQR